MKGTKFLAYFIISFFCYTSLFAQKFVVLEEHFDSLKIPATPDYTQLQNWAALPQIKDYSDSLPSRFKISEKQGSKQADVFFLHPTTFTYKPKNQYQWNADIQDAELNQKTDETTILNQASAFNESCHVYAPRYRQAHYYSFLTTHLQDKEAALNIAYQDIRKAFLYYLEHWNQGRPIIIASHSQGTVHAKRLLKEFFDGKSLQKQLVEAYLIGIATLPDTFENIQASQTASDFGGFVSWNTYARGYFPEYFNKGLNKAVCTNPLTWKITDGFAPKEANKGGISYGFRFVNNFADAENHQGLLWINKPYVPGRIFLKNKIWHFADINLFWMNIRENVALRIENYLLHQSH